LEYPGHEPDPKCGHTVVNNKLNLQKWDSEETSFKWAFF
jgi:hypothetical protein